MSFPDPNCRFTLFALALLVTLAPGCGVPIPGPGAPFREQSTIVTPGDAPIRVAAAPVGQEATTLESVVLDRPYRLEFLPLIEGDSVPEGLELRTYVVTESGGRMLSSDDLVPMGPLRADPEGTLAELTNPVRIDLSAYTNQTVALRWAIEPVSAESRPRAYVAGLKLRLAEPPLSALPDILMICSDTHRYDFSLGEEGRELMPNLQRLAGQSLIYDWTFSASSWTLPSIASIFTGLPPRYHQAGRRTGLYAEDAETPLSGAEFEIDWGKDPYEQIVLTRFPRELTTLGETLQTLGYTTAIVAANPMYHLSGLLVDGVDIPIGMNPMPGDQVNEVARNVLRALPDDGPVLLVVHYMDVHQWIRWYYDRDYPGSDAAEDSLDVVLGSYSESVGDSDRFLGQLLDLWQEFRNPDDSLVMFFADHGEHLLDPTLGHGNTMEDALLRVPLVVKYPRSAGITPGQKVTRPVSLTDLVPTILGLVGSPIELPPLAGRSLLDAAEPADEPRTFFADFQLYGDELSSARRGDFKLVVNLDRKTSETTRWRMADNLGREDPETSAQTTLLVDALTEYGSLASEASRNLEAAPADAQEAIDALKSLGYIQ